MNKSKKLRWAGLLGYMVLIFIGSSIPGNTLSETGLFNYDKLLHLAEYTVLGIFTGWFVIRIEDFGNVPVVDYALAIGIGWLFAVTDEIHQHFVPGRSMDPYDLVADAAGILIGILLYRYAIGKLLMKIEKAV